MRVLHPRATLALALCMVSFSGVGQVWSAARDDASFILQQNELGSGAVSVRASRGNGHRLALPVADQPCGVDTTPPSTPSNLRVSSLYFVSWGRAVTLIADPTVLATNNSRPGHVRLDVQGLSAIPFTPGCSGLSTSCDRADQYVVEEAIDSSFSMGVITILQQPFQWTSSSVSYGPFVRPSYGERRYYRVRFQPGGKGWGGCVLKTPSVPVDLLRKVEVEIRNQLAITNTTDIYSDSKLVRIRIAGTQSELKSGGFPPEQLASDSPRANGSCASAKGDELVMGNARSYLLDDGLSIFRPWIQIGLGDWVEMGSFLCGGSTWEKRAYYVSTQGPMYRYVEYDLGQCFGVNALTLSSATGNLNPLLSRVNSSTPSCSIGNVPVAASLNPPVDRY